MSNTIDVELGLPESGWIHFSLAHGKQKFEIEASYTPNDFVTALTQAVTMLMKGLDEAIVPLNENSDLSELHLLGDKSQISVIVISHPDHRRVPDTGRRDFEAHGSRRNICLVFWRALRRLESKLSCADFEQSWGHPFPTRKLQELSSLMRQKPGTSGTCNQLRQ